MQAIDDYADELEHKRGNRPSSYVETPRRLRSFFAAVGKGRIANLRAEECEELYADLTERKATMWRGSGKQRKLVELDRTLSVDTCRNMLLEARSFLKWCVGKKWLTENPLAGVEGEGRRKHGKPQLRIDESRLWLDKASELAGGGDVGAIGAMCALLLGLRATEITLRQVRDLDDDGRLLWIPDSKTEAGRRTVEVPEVLRGPLRALAANREPTALLFGDHWRDWPRRNIQRICEIAKVPMVSAHGMRGTASTIATEAGAVGHLIAAQLGHADKGATAAQSYIAPGTAEREKRKRGLGVLDGGKARR
jgi:integrase